MRSSNAIAGRGRALALAVCLGVLGSALAAGPALAASPAVGTACQGASGKVNGRGATFQTRAQTALIAGYTADVCGATTTQGGTPNMIIYNWSGAPNGSGAGLNAASCRTDAFAGSDIPFTTAAYNSLNAAPGNLATVPAPDTGTCALTPIPPFPPNGGNGTYPDAVNDTTAPVMAIPVAGSSVALGIKLTSGGLPGTVCPTSGAINLTAQQASRLLGGEIQNWNDASLVTNNASLANCNKPVKRVVRNSSSGTTQTIRNFLVNQPDHARTGAVCGPSGLTWDTLNTSTISGQTVSWPGLDGTFAANGTNQTGGTCSTILTASGGGGVVTLTNTTDGAIGYADSPDWKAAGAFTGVLANLRNQTDTAYVSPTNVTAANCTFAGSSLPGADSDSNVGLNGFGASLASDYPDLNGGIRPLSDLTWLSGSAGYPICGFTWDLVYTGLSAGSSVANPIKALTDNQRMTLYSYFTYLMSPGAQDRLKTVYYAPVPAGFLKSLRTGFQSNF